MQNQYRLQFLTLLLWISGLMPMSVAAKSAGDSARGFRNGYLASYWYNGIGLLKSPLHWNADQWIGAGTALTMTGLVVSMDDAVSQPLFKWDNSTGNKVGKIGNTAGDVPVQLGLSALALGAGWIAKNKPLKNFALDNFQAQLYTGGLTLFVKEAVHRARPFTGAGAYAWYGPYKGRENDAFFSGHTSIAFSTATMIFLHSHKKWWVGLLTYTAATAIGLSRIQQQKHWASDVVMGAVIGSSVSSYVYHQQEKRRQGHFPAVKALP